LEMKNKVKVAVTRSRVTDYQNHKYMTIIPWKDEKSTSNSYGSEPNIRKASCGRMPGIFMSPLLMVLLLGFF
jgi:hypothetical protein